MASTQPRSIRVGTQVEANIAFIRRSQSVQELKRTEVLCTPLRPAVKRGPAPLASGEVTDKHDGGVAVAKGREAWGALRHLGWLKENL